MSAYDEDPERAKRFTWNDGDVEIIKGGNVKNILHGGLKTPEDNGDAMVDAE